jgi:hypothetical protein|tara:strand:+ start:31 stop:2223 length:2193 start_codon:yes stop_codon:yes gene_type:complete
MGIYDNPNNDLAKDINGNLYTNKKLGVGGTPTAELHVKSGEVMVGSSSPQAPLHVQRGTTQATIGAGTALQTSAIFSSDLAATTGNALYNRLILLCKSGGNIHINFGDEDDMESGAIGYDNVDDSLFFRTNSGERMTIQSDGKVGIGTASPTRTLDVMNPDGQPQGRFSYNAGNFLEIGVEDNTGTGIIKASGGMLVLDPAITKVNGKLGVGLAAPSTALTVEGAVTLKEQAAADTDVAAYGQVWVKTATPNELYFTTDAGDDIQLTTGTGTTGASALNDLSDVSYSSGDLIITSLDKLTTSATAHNAAGRAVIVKAGDTTAGTTNNIAGGDLTIAGGIGKGSGAGGDIIFQTANAGGSGSSLNSLATAMTISDDLSIEAGGDINFTGENVTCGKFIAHYGDTDTRIAFFNAGDIIALEAGGVEFLKCHETAQDELIVNSLSGDVDFRVVSDDESHMLFVDANNNRVSIGDSTDAPAATLEVANHASAGAYDVPLVQLNSLDTDQIALDINAGNIDANVVDITCADLTESNAIFIQADGLTTGNALNVVSNSDSTAVRALISLKNDHVDATGVTGIALTNDSLADGGVGAIFNATMGGNGSVVGLRIKELQVTFPNSGPDAELIVASFFPANCVPIALGIRITTAITGGYVTKIGTTSDDDAFGTYADNTLEQVDDNLVAAWSPTQTQGEEGMYFRSTASLKFTLSGVPSSTAGVARIALYHYQITAPTG